MVKIMRLQRDRSTMISHRLRSFALVFATSAALTVTAGAAQAQVKVGLISVLSGPQATLGQQVRDGFLLGVESVGGKLGGLPAEVTVIDDEMKPDVAVTKVRGLMESQHVNFVVGPVFSNILQAIFKPVTESDAILISPNAGPSTYAGRACNASLFVTSYQNDQIHAVMGKVAQDKGYKRVFLLAPNYQAGRDSMAGFKSAFKGEIVDEDYVPLTQLDFQSEIAKIAAAKPDAVFAFMPGGLGINLVKQYRQAGLEKIPFLSNFTVDESVLPAEKDDAVGFYHGSRLGAQHGQSREQEVRRRRSRRSLTTFRGSYAAQAYDTALLIDSAVRSAGGVGDKAKLRAALAKADFESVRGNFKFGVNHYPVQDFYLAQVAKRPDGKYQTEIREKIFSNDVDPYAAQCKMEYRTSSFPLPRGAGRRSDPASGADAERRATRAAAVPDRGGADAGVRGDGLHQPRSRRPIHARRLSRRRLRSADRQLLARRRARRADRGSRRAGA